MDASTGKHIKKFQKLQFPQQIQFDQLDAHFTQSLCLTKDGQILQWGWTLDQHTSTRTLSYYKNYTNICLKIQDYFPNSVLGMRNYLKQPNLMNSKLIDKHLGQVLQWHSMVQQNPIGIQLKENSSLYGMGDNYKGQLGLGDTLYRYELQPCVTTGKIKDFAAGYQHSLILNDQGTVFATGKKNYEQFILEKQKGVIISNDHINQYQRLNIFVRVKQIACGFHHSVFLLDDNRILTCGLNNHGQCGHNNLQKREVNSYHDVYTDLEKNEKILQICCGRSHTLYLTDKNRLFFFGATMYNQLGYKNQIDIDYCSPQEIKIKLEKNEKIIKIKANFDRSCIFTDFGNAYVFGGENFEQIAEDYSQVVNLKQELNLNDQIQIKDVGLGYLHTLVLAQ